MQGALLSSRHEGTNSRGNEILRSENDNLFPTDGYPAYLVPLTVSGTHFIMMHRPHPRG